MNRTLLISSLALVILVAAAGCTDAPVIEIAPPRSRAGVGEGETGTWESLMPDPVQDPRTKPKFILAEDAEEAPVLRLTTFQGERRDIRAGEPGKVTLVVFWSMALPVTKAAARHVSDLEKNYRQVGVAALGVVERRTHGFERASEFLLSEGIQYPVYCDDFGALRRMARAAGVKVKQEVPCFFMVDRNLRVRLFKRGFSFSGSLAAYPIIGEERVFENAAPGEKLEDLLRRLILER